MTTDETITISRDLFKRLIDAAIELRSEWAWRKNESRCGYADAYDRVSRTVQEAVWIQNAPSGDMSENELAAWTEAGKCEVQLQAAVQRLQAVLPIGKVKAIGLMEVATGIDELIAENVALKDALAKARFYAVNRQKEHPIGLRDFATECGVSPTQMSVWTSGRGGREPLGPPDIICRR